jgi:hypothetical protein
MVQYTERSQVQPPSPPVTFAPGFALIAVIRAGLGQDSTGGVKRSGGEWIWSGVKLINRACSCAMWPDRRCRRGTPATSIMPRRGSLLRSSNRGTPRLTILEPLYW